MGSLLGSIRKSCRIVCIFLAIGIVFYILRSRQHRFVSIDFAEKQVDMGELRERVIQIVKASRLAGSTFDVDVVHRQPNSTFLLVQLDRSQFIKAPRNWCYENAGRKDARIRPNIQECFSEVALSDYQQVKWTLRLIRDAFEMANVTVVITFGSLLGSLRYQKRMPYDTDFDLLVHQKDRDKALQIFLKLAADPLHRMRLLDLKPLNISAKIGLACEPDTKWMNPDRWTNFGGSVQFRRGVPTGLKITAYHEILGTCAIPMDMFSTAETDAVFDNIDEYEPLYRPLDGTLFRVFRGAREYLEKTYNASLDVCIPKFPRFLPGRFHNLPRMCEEMVVPCSMLDLLYPRVIQFTDTKYDSGTYEVGMEFDHNRQCWIHSIFHYRS
ncbi:unnamed protein product [Mesocestoides corti]|nr:unnamed protein product [Mesocestoides corti]